MKDFTLQDEMPISVEDFWNLFFRDEEFTLIFHERRGDSDTQVGVWTPAPEGRKQRLVRFLSPTASNSTMRRIAGVTTQIKEIQLCHFTPEGSFQLSSKHLFEKTSLVEIDCKVLWEVAPSNNGCKCTIKCSNEYKGKLFKDAIENYVREETQDAFEQWLSLAHEKISDYLPDLQYAQEQAGSTDNVQGEVEVPKGDESEEDLTPIKKTFENTNESLKESATERAKRIIASKISSDEETSEDEEEDETSEDEDEAQEGESSDEGEGFYEASEELSSLARFDKATSPEEKLALLQAYSRAMQMELQQMKELVMHVQTRMMRLETPQPSATPQTTTPHFRNGKTPLSESGGWNVEERERKTPYRDLALQRQLTNTQRRLEELEQQMAARLPPPSVHIQTTPESKKKGLLPLITNNGWMINVPFIVFVICWPLVSHRVLGWGMDWGSRLLAQIQKFVSDRFS